MKFFSTTSFSKKVFSIHGDFTSIGSVLLILCAVAIKLGAQEASVPITNMSKPNLQATMRADNPIHAADLFFPGDDEYDEAF
ncbi:MAG TPA: hypothetical protein PLH76_09045, partial [Rectinema sp.]|nr:hypothetical protein [Rectinema sp.]